MKLSILVLFSFHYFLSSAALALAPVNALVWDLRFAPESWPSGENQGSFGNSFHFSLSNDEPLKGPHGMQVAYVLMKDNPSLRLHLAYNPGIPGQDPEKCMLVEDLEFLAELERLGYERLPNCRAQAEEGIARLSRFIRDNHIRIVNISHGVYYDHYVLRNPYFLLDRYPKMDIDFIQKFLYRNFLAIGEIAEKVFAENPDTIFVLAAGNNDDEVDRYLYLKWYEEPRVLRHVPTHYASYTSKYDNVVSLASTYNGEKIAPGSNYGDKNVFAAKKIGEFSVPDGKGGWIKFGGTSAAAAETSRLFSLLLAEYPELSAKKLKELAASTVRKLPGFEGKTSTGGVIDEAALRSAAAASFATFASPQTREEIRKLKVVKRVGKFREFELPSELNVRNYGCHSLVVAPDGLVWMTMPWSNSILSFNPSTEQFQAFPLPTPSSKPDGIAVDKNGVLWFGLDPKGGLGSLDPKTGKIMEYPHPDLTRMNILSVDASGVIWSTSHDTRTLSNFDPVTGAFQTRRVYTDWPLDVQAAADGTVWVAGLKGYDKPWGPGAIVQYSPELGSMNYFPLPNRENRLQAYWLYPTRESVYLTLMRDGLIHLNRATGTMVQLQREDNRQIYNIVRQHPNGALVFTNAHEQVKSLDLLNPDSGNEIFEYQLPNQQGEPREGLSFDRAGNIWFCQTFTNVLVKLSLE